MTTVEACPECDRANPYKRRQRFRDYDHAYVCMGCGERFDEAVTREKDPSGGIPGDSLARQLLDADPDVRYQP